MVIKRLVKMTPNPAGDGGAGRGDKLAFRMQSSHEGDHQGDDNADEGGGDSKMLRD